MTVLAVALFGQRIGDVAVPGPLPRPEDWTFTYAAGYLGGPAPVALSVSLPPRADPYAGAAVRNWFCNLLPEGAVRESVAERLRIPPRDDFALLAAIGGECAGAVSVGPSEPSIAMPQDADLEPLVERLGEDAGEGTWALLGTPLRLSLAGAQDKIAVVVEPDGRLRLPAIAEPSTHILKPDSRRFRGLRDFEALGLALAQAVGLDVPAATPVEVAGHAALLVERYDRRKDVDGIAQRLHQEDFCQALGYPAELKYEGQGGPGLAACSTLLRRLGIGPAAVQGLLDWVAFNVLIGNVDAHAKNLALLCGRDGRRRLAPFYDLVPTLVLPETLVDRAPALRIGNAARVDAVAADDWRTFAREAGYAPRFVLQRVAGLADRLLDRLHETCGGLVERGVDERRLERAAAILEAHIRCTRDASRAQ